MQSFADEGKYDITNAPGSAIQQDYEEKRTDAWEHIENLQIVKRIISVCKCNGCDISRRSSLCLAIAKLVQANRAAQGGAPGLSRTATSASTSSTGSYGSRTAPPPSRSATVGSSFKKAPPPPPPSSSYSAAPPPYSPAASSSSVASAAGKRAPPPPPLKPKPKPPVPQVVYVSAVYDFEAQAEGDLSFRAGDRIELVKKTDSQEDWWTGRLNGQEGVFPGEPSLFWTVGRRKI